MEFGKVWVSSRIRRKDGQRSVTCLWKFVMKRKHWDPRRPGQARPGQGGLAVYMFLSNARLKQVDEVRV